MEVTEQEGKRDTKSHEGEQLPPTLVQEVPREGVSSQVKKRKVGRQKVTGVRGASWRGLQRPKRKQVDPSQAKEEDQCHLCKKKRDAGKQGHINWQGCNCCHRWFHKSCLQPAELCDQDTYWKCQVCTHQTQPGLERVTTNWQKHKEKLEEVALMIHGLTVEGSWMRERQMAQFIDGKNKIIRDQDELLI
jgi:hypothetical protein